VAQFVVGVSHLAGEIIDGLRVRIVGQNGGCGIRRNREAQAAHRIVLEVSFPAELVLRPFAAALEIKPAALRQKNGEGEQEGHLESSFME
jgi:hypothetical protein